jgi:acetyltransferase EpsM
VSLAGDVVVAEGALLGIGSSVIPGIHVGPWATVGAGAAVVRDLEEKGTFVGVPTRRVREC